MKNNKKVIISTVIMLALALSLFIGYKSYEKSQLEAGSKGITVTVIDTKTSLNKEYKHRTDAEMLGTALDELKLIKTETSQFGRYVTAVSDIPADMSKNEWWKFTINGVDSVTGIDSTPIKDGDKIEITFTVGF